MKRSVCVVLLLVSLAGVVKLVSPADAAPLPLVAADSSAGLNQFPVDLPETAAGTDPAANSAPAAQVQKAVAGWASQTRYRFAQTQVQRNIVANANAAAGRLSGRSVVVSPIGGAASTTWLTDVSGGDGARMRAAAVRLHGWFLARPRVLTLAQVRTLMLTDFNGSQYDLLRKNFLVDRIISQYTAAVNQGVLPPSVPPRNDQETLDFLGVQEMCLEFAVRTGLASGGRAKGYASAAVANAADYRPGMGLFRANGTHAMILVDIQWNAQGLPVLYRVAEANFLLGDWQNPPGQFPWARAVSNTRTLAPGDRVIDFEAP